MQGHITGEGDFGFYAINATFDEYFIRVRETRLELGSIDTGPTGLEYVVSVTVLYQDEAVFTGYAGSLVDGIREGLRAKLAHHVLGWEGCDILYWEGWEAAQEAIAAKQQ